jgi:hypothetical protein
MEETRCSMMLGEHQALMTEMPQLSIAENLALARQKCVEAYPGFFGVTPRTERPRGAGPAAPTNQGGRPEPTRVSGINAIEDPVDRAAARAAFESNKRAMPDYTEEEFMAVYNDPKADALQIRRDIRERNQPVRRARG